MPPTNETPITEDKYAVTSWGGSATEDLRLPSGQLCLAKRVGVQGLLESGIIHDIDPLMGMIQQHQDRVAGKPVKANDESIYEIMKDSDKMASLFHMLDRITCHVVVKPRVEMTPNDITNRKNGVVYCDMVDLNDKMFIMSWTLGGAEAVAGFREQYEGLVAGISDVPENVNTPE